MNENKKIIKHFSLDDLPLIRQDNDTDSLDFFIARMGFIASGENRQDCYISEETLKTYAPTIKGKFVTAKYSWWEDDVQSHEKDLDIIGYIPFESEVTFERTEDGRLMAFCEAVLSKIYCFNVYQLFRKENYRSVSAEFSCSMKDEDSDTGEIVSMNFHSITILGKEISPAIPDANMKVVKFSKEEANSFYVEQNSSNSLKQFSEKRKRMLENKDNDKSSREENMGTDKKQKEFEEKEKNTEDVVMEDKKEMSTEESDNKEKDKEMSDEKQDEKKFEDTQEIADKEQDEKDEEEEDEVEEKEFSADKEKEKEPNESEKKFSLDAYVDATATLAMLEKETEERKELAKSVLYEMGAEKLFSTIMELSKENSELKKYQEDNEKVEKERKFSAIMADVKGDIPEETYKQLYEEGKNLKFSEMENFGIKVKAFAYDNTRNKTDGFRIPVEEPSKSNTSHDTVEDIFNQYL